MSSAITAAGQRFTQVFQKQAEVVKPPPPPPPAPPPLPDWTRHSSDGMEKERTHLPLPPPIDAQMLIDRIQYRKDISAMSDDELKTEVARQDERRLEATTGLDRDPEKAADAKWRADVARDELERRALMDPGLSLTEYRQKIEGLSDSALSAEEKRLGAAIDDARTGPHTNAKDAKALEAKLAAVKSEKAQRIVDDADAPLLSYAAAARHLTDDALAAEESEVRAEYQALVKKVAANPDRATMQRLEKVGDRLDVLDHEMHRRGLERTRGKLPDDEVAPVDHTKDTVETAATDAATEVATATATRPSGTPVTNPAETPVTTPDGAPNAGNLAAYIGHGTGPASSSAPAATDCPGAPTSQAYTVVGGDTLSLLAANISSEHGGDPSADQVLADILVLNPLPNPDLIEIGQVLQLPVYPT